MKKLTILCLIFFISLANPVLAAEKVLSTQVGYQVRQWVMPQKTQVKIKKEMFTLSEGNIVAYRFVCNGEEVLTGLTNTVIESLEQIPAKYLQEDRVICQ